jgi:phage tail protein X
MGEIGYKRKLVDYFKKNLRKGYTKEALQWALVNQGYSRTAVESALEEANIELAELAPIIKEKPKITHQIIDEYDNPIVVKKSWLRRVFG